MRRNEEEGIKGGEGSRDGDGGSAVLGNIHGAPSIFRRRDEGTGSEDNGPEVSRLRDVQKKSYDVVRALWNRRETV